MGYPGFDKPKHYDVRLIVQSEDMVYVETDRQYEPTYLGVWSPSPIHSEEFVIRAKAVTFETHPGSKLQALIDLGYTEEQGVQMLDSLDKEN